MDIAAHLMVGESISYAKKDIVSAIEQGRFPDSKNWYAITTAHEQENLLYILSGEEYRLPMYHRENKTLKLIGIAGSKSEAISLVHSMIQEFADYGSMREIKTSLAEW